MENQHERNDWNERWQRQIALWWDEVEEHLDDAEALVALINLAKAQIQQDPPE